MLTAAGLPQVGWREGVVELFPVGRVRQGEAVGAGVLLRLSHRQSATMRPRCDEHPPRVYSNHPLGPATLSISRHGAFPLPGVALLCRRRPPTASACWWRVRRRDRSLEWVRLPRRPVSALLSWRGDGWGRLSNACGATGLVVACAWSWRLRGCIRLGRPSGVAEAGGLFLRARSIALLALRAERRGAAVSGGVDKERRRPSAASARGPRERAALDPVKKLVTALLPLGLGRPGADRCRRLPPRPFRSRSGLPWNVRISGSSRGSSNSVHRLAGAEFEHAGFK